MLAVQAMLQIEAITTMLLTRLNRSAIHATGTLNTAAVTEITETSRPSSLSDRLHAALGKGNIETMIWRSMKSKSINAIVIAYANHAALRPYRNESGSGPLIVIWRMSMFPPIDLSNESGSLIPQVNCAVRALTISAACL